MKKEKWFKATSIVLGTLLITIVGVLSFYILYNAQWLIGDDAILINKTGWDIPFTIWGTIQPELGRFFPFAYLHENLVLLLSGDTHSAQQHYVINVLLLAVLITSLTIILFKTIRPTKTIDLLIVFCGVLLCTGRFYGIYNNVFSTVYNYFSICSCALMFGILFYCNKGNKTNIYAILSILFWMYSTYCLENAFILPLVLGSVTLLFGYKKLTKEQRIFNFFLIAVALVFLSIYFFGIYLQKEGTDIYDPAHGTGVTIWENAVNMLKGQKFLLFATIVWLYRQYILLNKKDTYHIIYDSLLWTAGALLIVNIILRLNWSMYYYPAIIVALPAVVYFLNKHFGKISTLIVLVMFMALHSYKIPIVIKENQKNRIDTKQYIDYIVQQEHLNKDIIWYEIEVTDSTSYDIILRNWKKESLRTYIQFELKDRNWDFDEYDNQADCIVLYPKENDMFGNKPLILSELQPSYSNDIALYKVSSE